MNEWGHSCSNELQKYLSQEPESQKLGKDFAASKEAMSGGKTYSSGVVSDTRALEWVVPAVGQGLMRQATESCFIKITEYICILTNII